MEFQGTFTLEEVTPEEVWLALSDPVMIKNALPGCQFLLQVENENPDFDELAAEASDSDPPILPEADPEDVAARVFEEGEHWAALMQLSVGSVEPRFETVVTIDEREFPEMAASGEGNASDSAFEMNSGLALAETDEGVDVNWWAEADVFGRIAQMGQRMINPVAQKVANRFFSKVEDNLNEVSKEGQGLRERIRSMI